MADPRVGSVPFQEAIDYFRQKLRLPTATWTDLWQGMHARAFVVAGAMKDDLLRDLQAAIMKAIEQGTTIEEFRRDFDRIVEAHGWSYRGGRNWRTRVIFNTNLRMAAAAGKWDQAQRLKRTRPYMRYVAIDDDRTRPLHHAWSGTVLPIDDPWWKTHYPPNGWNCRCTVQTLSERDLKRYKLKVSEKAPPVEMLDRDVNFPDGKRTIQVPAGIDPGFGYNPGEAAYGTQLADEVMDRWRSGKAGAWEQLTPGNWESYGRPRDLPVDETSVSLGAPAVDAAGTAAAIARAIGGAEKLFDVPDGSVVAVNAATLASHIEPGRTGTDRAATVPLLPELLTDPFEVWITFERHQGTGRVELRKRLVKVVRIGEEKRGFVAVAQVVEGRLEAWTFVPANQLGYLRGQRRGRLLYGRPIVQESEEG
jgi:SPP1 gp7 family putative phage head morphogenesis protein